MKTPSKKQLGALRHSLEVANLTHADRMMRSIECGNADTAGAHAKMLVGSLRATDALYEYAISYPFHEEEVA